MRVCSLRQSVSRCKEATLQVYLSVKCDFFFLFFLFFSVGVTEKVQWLRQNVVKDTEKIRL